jgi:catechol 2,3-dioxygenase-like lactoylglutathione lyase family enzyme
MTTKVKFTGGRNIAMKVPPHVYEATVQFYRDVLGLKEITKHAPSVGFEFGSNQLWIDRVPGMSQAETWLEVISQ